MFRGIAQRVASARAAKGLSVAEVASAVGINDAWAYDLEAYDDDLPSTLSLGQVCRLATVLGTSPRALACGSDHPQASVTVSPEMVVQAIQTSLVAHGQSVDEFSHAVGWDVQSVLDDPRRIWPEWCLDQAHDVCSRLGIDWRTLLPGTDSEAAV
jgi:transcriptional regulator with XRE-family HTH domain